MQNYEIIPKQMALVGDSYENVTKMPEGEEYNGVFIGVGFPKIHNLYRGAWNPKRKQMVWSFVMLVNI